jgi:hypothetical protein
MNNLLIQLNNHILTEAVVVVIAWLFDLQLPVQSVPITTKVVSSNPDHGKVYSIQQYVIKFVSNLRKVCVLPRYSCFYHHDITDILLKVVLKIITLTHNLTPVNLITFSSILFPFSLLPKKHKYFFYSK